MTDTIDIPRSCNAYKHTRRAYRYGHSQGRTAGEMFNVAELEHQAEESLEEYFTNAVESENWWAVGADFARSSRDLSGSDGVHRLNQLGDIIEGGVALSRLCDNGDSCMIAVYGGASSGVVTGRQYLTDETLEAYDAGYADAFEQYLEG